MKFPAHAWTRACTGAIFLVRHPCSHFPALWKCYTLPGTSPERGLSDPCCALPLQVLPPQLVGSSLSSLTQTGRAEPSRAEPSTRSSGVSHWHPALALTPFLPRPFPSPHGGLTFNWPDDHKVGRASSCLGWLFSIKLTRVLGNHVATPCCVLQLCADSGDRRCTGYGVNCIIETVGVISSSSGFSLYRLNHWRPRHRTRLILALLPASFSAAKKLFGIVFTCIVRSYSLDSEMHVLYYIEKYVLFSLKLWYYVWNCKYFKWCSFDRFYFVDMILY